MRDGDDEKNVNLAAATRREGPPSDEVVAAVRAKLASLEASLNSTDMQIEVALDALVRHRSSQTDTVAKIRELRAWLAANSRPQDMVSTPSGY